MFNINSGELREKIIIRRKVKSNSVLEDDTYKDIYTFRAKVKGIGGNEFLSNDSINMKQTYNFIIRKSRSISLKNNDIIFYNNKEFNITYINDSLKSFIELKGVEV